MFLPRVIPVLLKKNGSLVKTVKFSDLTYIGDPVNTVQIFNNLEVDEIVFLDITATNEKRVPDFDFISHLTDECFMPFAYGGGITKISEMKTIFSLGCEKVILCTAAHENPQLIKEAANKFGSQSIIISVDVKKNFWGKYEVFSHAGKINMKLDPIAFAKNMQELGAGEILLNSIDNDGTMKGYDLELTKKVSSQISIPLVSCGGCGKITDIKEVIDAGASAAGAGSLFIYQNTNRAVLINFPTQKELKDLLQ